MGQVLFTVNVANHFTQVPILFIIRFIEIDLSYDGEEVLLFTSFYADTL